MFCSQICNLGRLCGNIPFSLYLALAGGSKAGAGVIWRLNCLRVPCLMLLLSGTLSETVARTSTHCLSMLWIDFLRECWLASKHLKRTGQKLYCLLQLTLGCHMVSFVQWSQAYPDSRGKMYIPAHKNHIVRRACLMGYINEAVFGKYYLPQVSFHLSSSFYCLDFYYTGLYTVDTQLMSRKLNRWIRVRRRQLSGLTKERRWWLICEDAACYLKSRIQGIKSHHEQLLGVARKSAYRMVLLGQLADDLSFLLCPGSFWEVPFWL